MPVIRLSSVVDGDVLAHDLLVDGVYLFGAGTVLTSKRISILKELKVERLDIESRHGTYDTKQTMFETIDKRFSYVDSSRIMKNIKLWVKDVVESTER